MGGMGRVYRVLDKKINEEIALKVIRPDVASDRGIIARFSSELKLARQVVHRNVARMFDLNEEHGVPYITMEYVKGENLKRLIRKVGRLSPGQAVPIACQICDGLAEAHRLGIVHRDLKPQNVMIDEEGQAKIMDFGLARLLAQDGPGRPRRPERHAGLCLAGTDRGQARGRAGGPLFPGRSHVRDADRPYAVQSGEPRRAPRHAPPRDPAGSSRAQSRHLGRAERDRHEMPGEGPWPKISERDGSAGSPRLRDEGRRGGGAREAAVAPDRRGRRRAGGRRDRRADPPPREALEGLPGRPPCRRDRRAGREPEPLRRAPERDHGQAHGRAGPPGRAPDVGELVRYQGEELPRDRQAPRRQVPPERQGRRPERPGRRPRSTSSTPRRTRSSSP